jgi:hypothetical protein
LADLSFSPVTPPNRREMIDYRARICFPEWETKCCGVQKYIVFACRVPSRTPAGLGWTPGRFIKAYGEPWFYWRQIARKRF